MSTTMNTVGRPTAPVATAGDIPPTVTGARGLLQDEPLIFELGGWDKTGVDLPEAADADEGLSGLMRDTAIRRTLHFRK